MLGVVIGGAGRDPNVVHRHQLFHEWRGAWCGGDENARPVAEPQAQHHGIEYALLITHTRYFVDDHHFRLRPAQRFRFFAGEEHAHRAVWPFQPSPRRHPARPWITAAGREYTALAFDVDIVKVGRVWGDYIWGKSRAGKNVVRLVTAKNRYSRALAAVAAWCRFNRHQPIPDQHHHLTAMMRGHYAYYGITGNSRRLSWYAYQVARIWQKWLSRRDRGS